MTFQPSPQQSTFFDWISNGEGSCVLEAVAGAGKTTTLIKALELMTGSIFFGAYNKKIAEEIKARAPQKSKLFISTMHAAGFGMWRRVAGQVKVDNAKCRTIFRDAAGRNPQYATFETQVLQLVSYAKQAAIGAISSADDNQAWLDLIEHFDIDTVENDALVISLAKKTLQRSIEQDMKVIDFDDMIYAPLVHKVKAYEYDWVLIDEAQDTNAARRALSLMMLKRGGRLVAVGDRHQAIYGFTGADADALDLIAAAVSAKRLPLTVTYRCPKAVVEYARMYVSHITAHESAPEGAVKNLAPEVEITKDAKPGDAILCRFNAPIVKMAYQFIAAGIPAKVEGREIGTGLKTLARRWKSKSFDALLNHLDTHLERESAKYRAKEQESKSVAVEDRVNCLKLLITRVQASGVKYTDPVEALCTEIDKIFSDNVGDESVLLSSIHKSKGREWTNVYWLQTGPSKWARKDWELDQENNLCYVAATRAKTQLILVPADK
jgi:DNA helicase-2/ATP-dependent DNA helicase PcrA